MLYIGGFIPVTFSDFPGLISSILFTGGCNFKCPYCYNPHLVHKTSLEVLIEDIVPVILDKIDQIGLEGVVISGGEPLINGDLHQLLTELKKLDLKIKLDTNGSHPRRLKYILKHHLVDYIAMDLKGPLDDYSRFAGIKVETKLIRDSIKLIIESGVDHEFRQTVATPFTSLENIIDCLPEIKGAKRFILQPFMSSKELYSPSFNDRNKPVDSEVLLDWLDVIRKTTEVECKVRGMSSLSSKKVLPASSYPEY